VSGVVRLLIEGGAVAEFPCRFDPDELLSEEIFIDKLDAVCRQLESAITMFFHEWANMATTSFMLVGN
jgi:hypothetical protein